MDAALFATGIVGLTALIAWFSRLRISRALENEQNRQAIRVGRR